MLNSFDEVFGDAGEDGLLDPEGFVVRADGELDDYVGLEATMRKGQPLRLHKSYEAWGAPFEGLHLLRSTRKLIGRWCHGGWIVGLLWCCVHCFRQRRLALLFIASEKAGNPRERYYIGRRLKHVNAAEGWTRVLTQ